MSVHSLHSSGKLLYNLVVLGMNELRWASILKISLVKAGPPPPRLVCLGFNFRWSVGMSKLPNSPFLKVPSLQSNLLSSSVFQPSDFKFAAVVLLSIT